MATGRTARSRRRPAGNPPNRSAGRRRPRGPVVEPQVFCTECGAPLRGAKFCPQCGAATDNASPELAARLDTPNGGEPAAAVAASLPAAPPGITRDKGARFPPPPPVAAAPPVTPPPPIPEAPPVEPPVAGVAVPGWFERHRRSLVIAAGATVTVAAAVLGVLVFTASPATSPQRTKNVLSTSNAAMAPLLGQASSALLLSDLRAVGRQAQGKRAALSLQLGVASTIGDRRYRDAATAALQAEQSIVGHLGQLRSLHDHALAKTWAPIRQGLSADQANLGSANALVSGLALNSPTALVPPAAALGTLVSSLDTRISKAAYALHRWRLSVKRARARKRAALRNVNAYAATIGGYISQYSGLRDSLQNAVNRIASGVSYTKAYQLLGDATSQRQTLKDSITGLPAPNGAAGAAAAQNQVGHALGDSITAINDASSGLSDYQSTPGFYASYQDTPGWQQFESLSTQVASEFASANSLWESQISNRITAINHVQLPQRPNV